MQLLHSLEDDSSVDRLTPIATAEVHSPSNSTNFQTTSLKSPIRTNTSPTSTGINCYGVSKDINGKLLSEEQTKNIKEEEMSLLANNS